MPQYSVEGACHCKAIQFTCDGFDPSEVTRCNCSLCIKSGRLGVMLGNEALKIKQDDGSYKTFNFDTVSTASPAALKAYTPNSRPDGGRVNHHFCSNCGVDILMTEKIEALSEPFINVNILTIDLAKAGLDFKDVSNPKNMIYEEGRKDTWERRKNEPYEQGLW